MHDLNRPIPFLNIGGEHRLGAFRVLEDMSNRAKRRLVCIALALLTLVTGLVWRLAPLGLLPTLTKYGGSVLWAVMVYLWVAAIVPGWRATRVAILACLIAAAVECFRIVHTPELDDFRLTLAGELLLGRYFSIANIVTYWLAIGVAGTVDSNASHDHHG